MVKVSSDTLRFFVVMSVDVREDEVVTCPEDERVVADKLEQDRVPVTERSPRMVD